MRYALIGHVASHLRRLNVTIIRPRVVENTGTNFARSCVMECARNPARSDSDLPSVVAAEEATEPTQVIPSDDE
jgi:hypothetical protein